MWASPGEGLFRIRAGSHLVTIAKGSKYGIPSYYNTNSRISD